MSRHALVMSAAFATAAAGPSGLHRLQGRKPVRRASSRVAWMVTFLGLQPREGQDGRQ